MQGLLIGVVIRLSLIPAGVLAAAGDGGGGYTLDDLLKGGPFAICLALIITDKLSTTGERDRLRAENLELRSEIRELNSEIRRDITPLLGNNVEVLNRLEAQTRQTRPSRKGSA